MKPAKSINLRKKILNVPDFPKKGIVFRDISPLLLDPQYFDEAIKKMLGKIKKLKIDVILGIDSRGFLFGPVLARELKVGFIPVRKVNKLLPGKILEEKYKLEYGEDGVKIHADSLKPEQRVLIVDDLVATGGTALATAKLVEKAGCHVAALLFLTELCYLSPRKALKNYKTISIIKFK